MDKRRIVMDNKDPPKRRLKLWLFGRMAKEKR